MNKLITAYQANPTNKTIVAISDYLIKHPMSVSLLTREQLEVIIEALSGYKA